MSLLDMNQEYLSRVIGEPVPELYVVVAKNSVLEQDAESIAAVLGVAPEDVYEIQANDLYKQVRLLIAAEYAKSAADRHFSWDSLEQTALSNLAQRMSVMKNDPEFNLKVATLANRAQRRPMANQERTLDPRESGGKVSLSLTRRIVERIQGDRLVEETRQISVVTGEARNPSFQEIDRILGVTDRDQFPPHKLPPARDETPLDVDSILESMKGRINAR